MWPIIDMLSLWMWKDFSTHTDQPSHYKEPDLVIMSRKIMMMIIRGWED
jgi:hypothetical protein